MNLTFLVMIVIIGIINNPFINTPNADPYNLQRTINISSNNSYNLMKCNAVIMLKEILKHRERERARETSP